MKYSAFFICLLLALKVPQKPVLDCKLPGMLF